MLPTSVNLLAGVLPLPLWQPNTLSGLQRTPGASTLEMTRILRRYTGTELDIGHCTTIPAREKKRKKKNHAMTKNVVSENMRISAASAVQWVCYH